MDSPLHQFEIQELIPFSIGDVTLSFTNSALFMLLSVLVVLALFFFPTRQPNFIPSKAQALAEMLFKFVDGLVKDNIGEKGTAFLPLIFSVFTFILFGNLFGMLPYAYTFTSQIVLTFALALMVFLTVTILGFLRHGFGFFSYFLPKGTPLVMAPLLVLIEMISFLSRPVSLSIRLFANMMAGHTMLKVFSMFTISLGIFGFSTIIASVVLIGFEFMVAFLQAYVFSVLASLYIKDALELH